MGHDHSHDHGAVDYGKSFAFGIGLNLVFVLVEAIYGVLSNSLALVADAGHNLSDVLGLALAWVASVLARRAPSSRRTYGLRGSTILASLANAVLLYVAVGAIAWEGVQRLRTASPVETETVVWVAFVGVLINTGTALLFMKGRKGDINIRGAFLHMAADALVSVGVIVSALFIGWTGMNWIDSIVSIAIALVIGIGTWGLLKESVNLALAAVPKGTDTGAITSYLGALSGVLDVHDLHVWGMSTTDVALTVHLVVSGETDRDDLLTNAERGLHDRFGIEHATIQVEDRRLADHCRLAPVEAI